MLHQQGLDVLGLPHVIEDEWIDQDHYLGRHNEGTGEGHEPPVGERRIVDPCHVLVRLWLVGPWLSESFDVPVDGRYEVVEGAVLEDPLHTVIVVFLVLCCSNCQVGQQRVLQKDRLPRQQERPELCGHRNVPTAREALVSNHVEEPVLAALFRPEEGDDLPLLRLEVDVPENMRSAFGPEAESFATDRHVAKGALRVPRH
mmetsp:Transcript_40657/g.117610  ORF Transcript_40657/g.117610 Transcript_40657/m.117610 type:complete len:201 (-) Transcript_40657:1249-1851(-)